VIQVDLVAPKAAETPAPVPPPPKLPPLKENPLWDKLAKVEPPPPPKSSKPALADVWNKVSETPPPKPPTPKEPEDLKKWWSEQMRRASQTPQATSPEQAKIPERQRLADAWKDINASLPEAVRVGEAESEGPTQGELADWWKRQMAMATAPAESRALSATSDLAPGAYTDLIRSRLSARWSPPDVFRDGRAVAVTLSFTLMADGHVRSVRVSQSSGSVFYDQAAIRALYLSDPFPPFPKDIKEPDMDVDFTFSLLERSPLG
jgi:TonB family protein